MQSKLPTITQIRNKINSGVFDISVAVIPVEAALPELFAAISSLGHNDLRENGDK